jgi:hypothetical protein
MTKQASTSCSKEAGRCAQSSLASRFALLAFEAGFEDYCEREVDEVEWPRAQGSRSGGLTLAGDQAAAGRQLTVHRCRACPVSPSLRQR